MGGLKLEVIKFILNLSISTTNCPEQFSLGLLKTWQKGVILCIGQRQKENFNIFKMSLLLFYQHGPK
jgi:hypothetical protein